MTSSTQLKIWILAFILTCLVAWTGHGENYYVDYSAGADTNNGTSTNTAWKHCPGDFAVSGIPATNNLNPGDTIFFKGGVVYSVALAAATNIFGVVSTNSGITINYSGSAGSVITYDGTGNSWGTGRAVLDGNYLPNATAATFVGGVSYFTLNGFEIRNIGGYADNATNVLSAAAGTYTNTVYTSGTAIDCTAGNTTNLTFANLLIDQIGGAS